MNLVYGVLGCKQPTLLRVPATLPPVAAGSRGNLCCISGSSSLRLPTFGNGRSLPLQRRVLQLQKGRASSSEIPRSPGLLCSAQLTDFANIAPVTAAVYGASLLGGGLFAFTRTGSKGSLGGGITGGVALAVAFFLMQVPETQDLGNAIAFGAALLFASVFGIRLAATGKPLPSGLLLGVSALATVIFANAYFQTRL